MFERERIRERKLCFFMFEREREKGRENYVKHN
jgi:hypothetical protein